MLINKISEYSEVVIRHSCYYYNITLGLELSFHVTSFRIIKSLFLLCLDLEVLEILQGPIYLGHNDIQAATLLKPSDKRK